MSIEVCVCFSDQMYGTDGLEWACDLDSIPRVGDIVMIPDNPYYSEDGNDEANEAFVYEVCWFLPHEADESEGHVMVECRILWEKDRSHKLNYTKQELDSVFRKFLDDTERYKTGGVIRSPSVTRAVNFVRTKIVQDICIHDITDSEWLMIPGVGKTVLPIIKDILKAIKENNERPC